MISNTLRRELGSLSSKSVTRTKSPLRKLYAIPRKAAAAQSIHPTYSQMKASSNRRINHQNKNKKYIYCSQGPCKFIKSIEQLTDKHLFKLIAINGY